MSTNVRYVIPAPREADYLDFPEPEEGEDPLPNLLTTGSRNTQAQKARYFPMKQNEKEPISAFKRRFDHLQIKDNTGSGVPAITEARRALDLIMKLDNRKYRSMRSEMQNYNALCGPATAYPQSLKDFRLHFWR